MSKYCPECGQKVDNEDLHIVIVLDESGSMEVVRDSTISAINEFLHEQRKEEGRTWVTLTKFDTEFRPLYEYAPIEKVKPLDRNTYTPTGMTALHDAIGKTIHQASRPHKTKTMFVVMTDGQENSSKEYDLNAVKSLVESKKKAGWDFVFLGANIDSYAVGGNYGFSTTVNWKSTIKGIHAVASSLQNYSSIYRATGQSIGSAALQEDVDSEE